MTASEQRKYLVISHYGSIAIPLEALAACADIKFLDTDYVEKQGIVYHLRPRDTHEGRIIDASEIRPPKSEAPVPPIEPAPSVIDEEPF